MSRLEAAEQPSMPSAGMVYLVKELSQQAERAEVTVALGVKPT